MPQHQPFTYLCQQLARGPRAGRADLHLHTTASDGLYTPGQVVELARRCGLAAIAITDHDTLDGLAAARAAANGTVEVIAAVEITTEYQGREFHLLGYFVDSSNESLSQALQRVREGRVARFRSMLDRLSAEGIRLDPGDLVQTTPSLGRRHLAELMVAQGKAGSIREAFQKWLRDGGRCVVPKVRIPIEEAIRLVRASGGVAAWAHPSYDGETRRVLSELAGLGLGAVEVEYPEFSRSERLGLRQLAAEFGLGISGGSDCHGPGKRTVGACSISDLELDQLRQRRGGVCSAPCSTKSSKD